MARIYQSSAGGQDVESVREVSFGENLQEDNHQASDFLAQYNCGLLQTIIENAPAIIFMKEARELRFVFCNRMAESFFGYRRCDMIGKKDTDLFPLEQAAFCNEQDQHALNDHILVETEAEALQNNQGETAMCI